MDWFSAGIVFVVVWWLVLFMVLPFGAAPPDEVEPGMASSAPARPRLALKFLITTLIALAATALILWLIDSGLVSLRTGAMNSAGGAKPPISSRLNYAITRQDIHPLVESRALSS
jgi:predicted secreted protein